jgi:hypothetical protein
MARIGKAAASAVACAALLGGIGGVVFAAGAAAVPAGKVQVCNPTAIEYGASAGCAMSHPTAVEYAMPGPTAVEYATMVEYA